MPVRNCACERLFDVVGAIDVVVLTGALVHLDSPGGFERAVTLGASVDLVVVIQLVSFEELNYPEGDNISPWLPGVMLLAISLPPD